MVIVLKHNITSEQKQKLLDLLVRNRFKTNEIAGEESTIIAAVGLNAIDTREVELLDGVARVIPITKPYKMASREFKKDNTVVEIPNNRGQVIRVGGQRLVCVAGPCAVESRQQMMSIAMKVASSGAVLLRGGAYKPRTSPYSFQGLGEEGCKLLKEAGDKYGLPVVSEVVAAEFLPVMKDYIDVYQIGARNMQNFELLKKVGAQNKPVILKRGLCATIEEWLMAAEYLLSSGTAQVILCERGIRTFERATRNTLDLSAIPVLKSLTHLPVIVDPSHAIGIRDKIAPMALAAVAAGADGLIVEVHPEPDKALSDGPQSLYPVQFDKLMKDVEALAPVLEKEVAHIRPVEIRTPRKEADSTAVGSATKVCVFSGKKGAYAELAVSRYFDYPVEARAVDSFRSIFQAVFDGKADFGMVPIENSLAGSVYENYDSLVRYEDVSIVGAVQLRIRHSLLAVKGATLSSIKNVYSHPQPFMQCAKFLAAHKWTHIDAVSTATAACLVAKKGTKDNAAIANGINAQYYNLQVLEEGIEDDPRNYTRFVIIAANHIQNTHENTEQKPNMASFVFTTHNEPGALYNCLGIFQKHQLNLTRLESRPVAGEPWRYFFYADANITDITCQPCEYVCTVMQELKTVSENVRLLGIYREQGI